MQNVARFDLEVRVKVISFLRYDSSEVPLACSFHGRQQSKMVLRAPSETGNYFEVDQWSICG